jgi:hypothetical protein
MPCLEQRSLQKCTTAVGLEAAGVRNGQNCRTDVVGLGGLAMQLAGHAPSLKGACLVMCLEPRKIMCLKCHKKRILMKMGAAHG